jgi:CheY-like chemotaxis protein
LSQASDPALRGVLERLTVVVVDPSSTSRVTVRKALTDLGVLHENVHLIDNYRVAAKALAIKRPDIFLLEYDGEWGQALGVLREFRTTVDRAPDTEVFYTAAVNDEYVKSVAARDDVSGVFFKPYTYAYLSRSLAEAVTVRNMEDLYRVLLRDARACFWKGDVEGAKKQFVRAKRASSSEVHAHAYLGEIELDHGGSAIAAAKIFTEALRVDSSHYRCLAGNVRAMLALKKYPEAYVFHSKLLRNFPLIPSRLPEMIRLSMMLGKYEDSVTYLKVYEAAAVSTPAVRKSLGSALVVYGKRLIANQRTDDAHDVFEKAYGLCRGHEAMLVELFSAMLRGGIGEKAHRLLATEQAAVREHPEILLAEFEFSAGNSPAEKVVIEGTKLLRRGIKSAVAYEAVIRASVKLRRRAGIIDELIGSASADYPDGAVRFEKLRKAR